MPTYTLETPRGKRLTIEAQNDRDAMDLADRWDLQDHAVNEAQRLGVRPDLILKQMDVESGTKAGARSPKGALGPMQLMPGTAKDLGVDPSDPYQNITGGVTYLKRQLDAFGGDERKALAAYNAGPGAVQRAGGVPNYPETQKYVDALAGQGSPQAAPGLPAPPVSAPAPAGAVDRRSVAHGAPQGTSFRKGLEEGALEVAGNANRWADRWMGNAGLEVAPWVDAIAKNLGKAQTQAQAAHPEVYQREGSKAGRFAGQLAATGWIPGGPIVQGAAQGALTSNAKDEAGLLGDAALGGLLGKATAVGTDLVGAAARKALSKAPQIMSLPELEAAKKAAYKAVDASGFAFGKTDIAALANDFEHTVASSALSKTAKDEAQSIIDYTRRLANGGPVTLAQLEKLHGDIYTALVKKGGDTGVVGSQFRQKINGLIDSTGDTTVKAARDLNARFKKADVLVRKSRTADIQAEKDYGGDYGRKLKNRLFPLINPDQQAANLRGATPDELAAITQMVTGTKLQNAASMVGGMLDPRRLGGKILAGITSAGGGAAALPTGGMSLIAPAAQMAAGLGLTGAASGIARKNLNNAVKLIVAGGSKQALAPVPTAASKTADQLIAALRPALVASAVPAVAAANQKSKPKRRTSE